MQYRPTQAIINLNAITGNVKYILTRYSGYQHYMGVVKADCYGFRGPKVVQAILDGGVDCLAASLIEEGLALRQDFPEIPILLLTPVLEEQLAVCKQNQLMVSVANVKQAKTAAKVQGLQVFIRANGGSDLFGGPTDREGFEDLWQILQKGQCELSGLYLHSYNAENAEDTLLEYETFEKMTEGINLRSLKWVSIESSLSLPRYPKRSYANCCRLGNIMYGIESEDPHLESTFALKSQVLTMVHLSKGRHIAYSHAYTSQSDQEYLAAIPLGFGDGFSKTNIGRNVYIRGKAYPIVAITMDITHILVDQSVTEGDIVDVIADVKHLDEISAHIHGATEEAICTLNKRVQRIYIKD